MTYPDLIDRIRQVKFFSMVAEAPPPTPKGCAYIQSLNYWTESAPASARDMEICDTMQWLPTSHGQPDPFASKTVTDVTESIPRSEDLNAMRLTVAKLGMTATTHLSSPGLKVGPHDFNLPAKGALTYALRMAVTEIAASIDRPWQQCVEHYLQGRWPCGLLPNGDFVGF